MKTTKKNLTEIREQGYIEGSRQAWIHMLSQAIRHLGAEGIESAWIVERQETVAKLRSICEEYGDNDWPDNLHLADVIEKHLWRNLPVSQNQAEDSQ